MKFAEDDGRRLRRTSMRKDSIQNNGIVTDLASDHKGVSDSSLGAALDIVKECDRNLFINLVNEISMHCENENDV